MQNLFYLAILFLASTAKAAVLPDYATNTYQNHELTRAEQKCIDEGYKITYANCPKQTAPDEKCPHHDNYYKSCSQEQWCRNNNYTFKAEDCKAPFFPFKMCANMQPLYRICKEDIAKSCEAQGYTHKDKCQLTEKKCPFSPDYGICCDNCPNYAYAIDAIPAGYIAQGETCTTCAGIVKTNVVPAPCEGYLSCQYGPMSPQTPACQKAQTILYSACKTSSDVCKEKGYIHTSCPPTNDIKDCPENPNFKLCTINCLKQAQADHPAADVFGNNEVDPIVNIANTELRSLIGMAGPECQNQNRPELTLHINQRNLDMYEHLFDRNIENLNFKIIFEEPFPLYANGSLNNVKISVSGNIPECAFEARNTKISGVVSFNNVPKLCSNFQISENSKLLSTGDIEGIVTMAKDSSLGLKGSLKGGLKAHSYTEIFIKGSLEVSDNTNDSGEAESIVLGCNSKAKIQGGIKADTSSIYLKQWTSLDTPSIKLKSISDNPELHNTLSSLHMYKYVKIFNADGDTVFPLAENNNPKCDDMYYIHLGSATDTSKQEFDLQPANLLNDEWQCRSLNIKQQECN